MTGLGNYIQKGVAPWVLNKKGRKGKEVGIFLQGKHQGKKKTELHWGEKRTKRVQPTELSALLQGGVTRERGSVSSTKKKAKREAVKRGEAAKHNQ